MHWSQEVAEKRIADLGMKDLPLVQIHPLPHPVPQDWYTKYHDFIHEFVKTLGDSISELAYMNLPQGDFIDLVMGHRMPDNLSLRLRTPLVWGGKLEPDNMFLCTTFPHSYNMDRFIIEQNGNDLIWMPNPAKKVYWPVHMMNGGDGGNATSDRLSQMAAQIAASRGME